MAATNEVQVVTVTVGSGTFTLTYDGQTTTGIAFDAAAAAVDAALEALSNIPAGGVGVSGSAGGPYTVTFTGGLAGVNVPQMTGTGATVTTSTPGSTGDTTNVGVPMLPGDASEPQGPEDALGVGTKRGDYSLTDDGKTHYEGGVLQDTGPWGDHAGEPAKKGGVSTT